MNKNIMNKSSKIYWEDIEHTAKIRLPWDKLEHKSILISGASGLIGCFLVDVLMARNKLFGTDIYITALGRNLSSAKERFQSYWDDNHFTFVQQDINQPLVEIGPADYIIHAASNTHPVAYASDPVGTIKTNVFGTDHLLQYAISHKTDRFAFLSTVEIYGENISDTLRFTEQDLGYIDCNATRAGYPESKRLGEALCNAYRSKYGLDIVLPRLCRIYGPTMLDSDSKASSQFIKHALNKRDIVLKSDGTQQFSYCYIADCVSAILTILLLGRNGEAYNIADPASDVALRDLARIIAEIAGTQVIFELPDQLEAAGFSNATKALLDASKLKGLGWNPVDDIRTGMQKTIKILSEGR